MKVKALTSFSGKISMYMGEERDLSTKELIDDLVKAGYVKVIDETPPQNETPPEDKTKKAEKKK